MKITYERTGEFLYCHASTNKGILDTIDRIFPYRKNSIQVEIESQMIGEDIKPIFIISDVYPLIFKNLVAEYNKEILEDLLEVKRYEPDFKITLERETYNLVIIPGLESIIGFLDTQNLGYFAKVIENEIQYIETFKIPVDPEKPDILYKVKRDKTSFIYTPRHNRDFREPEKEEDVWSILTQENNNSET